MGQRHQAYIIAKVTPHGSNKPNYRCIGALHHQWCYGSLPLKAASRFIDLIKQKEHGEIIREEIKALDGKYGSSLRQPPVIPDIPCPFTSFLLNSAWAIDLSDGQDAYLSMAHYEKASMETMDGDNNDGVTIIDISDPESPSYCFALEPGSQPISAEQYIRHYYPKGACLEWEENLAVTCPPYFHDIPLVPVRSLAEAWPTEYSADEGDKPAYNVVPATGTPNEVPLLADFMLRPALEQALHKNDQEELLRLILPHKIRQIQEILRTLNPMPDGGVFVLSNILEDLKDKKVLDLSGFHLSTQQVLSLVPQDAALEVINLSHNHAVDIAAVEQLLTLHQALRRLVLLDTRISNGDVDNLLKDKPQLFYHVEAIVHPAFLKPASLSGSEDALLQPYSYAHISCSSHHVPSAVSLPFLNSAQILWALLRYMSLLEGALSTRLYSMNAYAAIIVMAIYTSPGPGHKWGERIISCVPQQLSVSRALENTQGWKVIWQQAHGISGDSIEYAFVKVNAEPMSRYLQERKQLNKDTISDRKTKQQNRSDLAESFKNQLFHVYDVREFFQQLELEGRPSPPPGDLDVLFRKFEELENRNAFLKLLSKEGVHEIFF